MTDLPAFDVAAPDPDGLTECEGAIGVIVPAEGPLGPMALRLDELTGGAVTRLRADPAFARARPGETTTLPFPNGLAADVACLARLEPGRGGRAAREAGAAVARAAGGRAVTLAPDDAAAAEDLALGALLGAYAFRPHKTGNDEPAVPSVTLATRADIDAVSLTARAGGVYLARDLTNEPANVLTTTEFAARLAALEDEGLEVEVLDEDRLADLGMRLLLAVGQGSDSPSKVAVLRWRGAKDAAPLALIGKGVVFDTGGISIKPAGGMEEMVTDMGGAGVVAGTMRALAARGAAVDAVGILGLVENMPDGRAQRPGDVVRSMKGDTVEVINTDAEGRLVLADLLWYAQERFAPTAIVDLATLTGSIVVALGQANAGLFSNDDALAADLLAAAGAEGEGLWRMPLGRDYDELLKSRVADMKNVAGRPAGAITAAQFLARFLREDQAWAHLDIAGVASAADSGRLGPAGATGWGVLTLDRFVRDRFEG